MRSSHIGPINIGSEEMVTINKARLNDMEIAGKRLKVRHNAGPLGVRGRNSDNELIRKRLGWEPVRSLPEGLEGTYVRVQEQVRRAQRGDNAAA